MMFLRGKVTKDDILIFLFLAVLLFLGLAALFRFLRKILLKLLSIPAVYEFLYPQKAFEKYHAHFKEHISYSDSYINMARCFIKGIGTSTDYFLAFDLLCHAIENIDHCRDREQKKCDHRIKAAIHQLMKACTSAPKTGEKLYCLGNALCLCNSPIFAPYFKKYFSEMTQKGDRDQILAAGKGYIIEAADMGYGEAIFTQAIQQKTRTRYLPRCVYNPYLDRHFPRDSINSSDPLCASGLKRINIDDTSDLRPFTDQDLDALLIKKAAEHGSKRAKIISSLFSDPSYERVSSLYKPESFANDYWIASLWINYEVSLEWIEIVKEARVLPNYKRDEADENWRKGHFYDAATLYRSVASSVDLFIEKYLDRGCAIEGDSLLDYLQNYYVWTNAPGSPQLEEEKELRLASIVALEPKIERPGPKKRSESKKVPCPLTLVENYYMTPDSIDAQREIENHSTLFRCINSVNEEAPRFSTADIPYISAIAVIVWSIVLIILGHTDTNKSIPLLIYLLIAGNFCFWSGTNRFSKLIPLFTVGVCDITFLFGNYLAWPWQYSLQFIIAALIVTHLCFFIGWIIRKKKRS